MDHAVAGEGHAQGPPAELLDGNLSGREVVAHAVAADGDVGGVGLGAATALAAEMDPHTRPVGFDFALARGTEDALGLAGGERRGAGAVAELGAGAVLPLVG